MRAGTWDLKRIDGNMSMHTGRQHLKKVVPCVASI